VCGDDSQQLAGEDGVDRLAVAVGEALQGQDLEAGDAHFQVGQAQELGDGVGEVGAPATRNQKPETRICASGLALFGCTRSPIGRSLIALDTNVLI
jgi:hypothetical protein